MMDWRWRKGLMSDFFRLLSVVLVLNLIGACSSVPVMPTPAAFLLTKTIVLSATEVKSPTPVTLTTWSVAEIASATKPEQCQPVAAIPKQLHKEWALGFINPNLTHSFFKQRDAGMTAAAAFYGVKYIGLDAKDGSSYNLLPSLLTQKPDLIGSHNDVSAIAAKAKAGTIPFVSVDLMPVKFDLHPYGVPDATAGKLGGELLTKGIKERLEEKWKGKEVFFLGFTANSIPACVTRVDAASKAVSEGLGLDEKHLLIIDPNVNSRSPEAELLIALQANPQAVFGMIPCWDQLGIDPYKSAVEAGYTNRILLVTLGGDQSNLAFLRTMPEGYYGLVEFQPFCEGWSWVETALAILEGIPYQPYEVRSTVTQSTVEGRYVELYGSK